MSKNTGSNPRLVALQHRDFRLLWLGQLVSTIGSQMQFITVNWHVFNLLEGQSITVEFLGREFGLDAGALGLGTLGLVRVIPIVLFALLGGLLADMRNRRQVLIWSHSVGALFSAILAGLTFSGYDNLVIIYLLTGAGAAGFALEQPSKQSLVPNLVPREHLTNAISLNTLLYQIANISGPALAGVLLSFFSLGVVYALDAVTFIAAIVAVALIQHRGQVAAQYTGLGWRALIEGLTFTYRSRLIWSTMLLDFFATFFGSARTMLPIVASDILGLGVQGYGLLATAQPIGAVIAGAVTALRRDIHRQGLVLLVSVGLYGLATAFFGLSTNFALSYLLFGLTGAGDTISTVIRGTLRQSITPDWLRGRMTSVNMVFYMGGPQLGELEAGLVAALAGVPFAIFTGGLATVLLTGWVAWKYPRLRRYTGQTATEAIIA
ncbi:MAG TPA: MFS transporter [Anaerolineae bacterium]|jgi:MFS family permease